MYMHYLFWESYLYPTCSTPKLEGRVTPEALRCWTRIPTKWAKQPIFNPKRIHLASCPGCFLDLLMNSESSTECTVLNHGFSMWLPRFWTSDGRWKKVGWSGDQWLVRLDSKKWNLGENQHGIVQNFGEYGFWGFLAIPSGDGQYGVAGQMPCKNLKYVGGSCHKNIPTVHGSLYFAYNHYAYMV